MGLDIRILLGLVFLVFAGLLAIDVVFRHGPQIGRLAAHAQISGATR